MSKAFTANLELIFPKRLASPYRLLRMSANPCALSGVQACCQLGIVPGVSWKIPDVICSPLHKMQSIMSSHCCDDVALRVSVVVKMREISVTWFPSLMTTDSHSIKKSGDFQYLRLSQDGILPRA